MLFVLLISILKQESASLVMTKTTAPLVTRESGLVQRDLLMNPTRLETWLGGTEIMGRRKLKPWDIAWFSDVHKLVFAALCATKFRFGLMVVDIPS